MDWTDWLNGREWAAVTWTGILLSGCLAIGSVRPLLVAVAAALAKVKLLAALALAAAYVSLWVCGFSEAGLWDAQNLKTTIVWAATFGFGEMMAAEKRAKDPHYYRKVLREAVTFSAMLTFVVQFYSFPYLVELVLLPCLACATLLHELSKREAHYQLASPSVGGLLSFSGFLYLAAATYKTFVDPDALFTTATAIEFLVPILLSVIYLPFLFGFRIYLVYDRVFSVLPVTIADPSLRRHAKRRAVFAFGRDVESLDRWRHAMVRDQIADKEHIARAIDEVRAMRRRDLSPPVVPPSEGWSPPLAIELLVGAGLRTQGYKRLFEDEWHASAPMKDLGDPGQHWRNNIAYYVDGSESVVHTLVLKINVNALAEAVEADREFAKTAALLVEAALGPGMARRLQDRLAALEPFEEELTNALVTLATGDGILQVKESYSRRLEISRGAPGQRGEVEG